MSIRIPDPLRPWLRWSSCILLVGILAVGAYALWFYRVAMILSNSQIQQAQVALAKGILIEDGYDDFADMGFNEKDPNENNPSPYRLAHLDVKSVQVGADERFIYCKVTFFDTIPQKPVSNNGDTIRGIGVKLNFVDEYNIDQIVFHLDTTYLPVFNIPTLNTYYSYGPTGIEWPEDARMAYTVHDSQIYGGIGTNYILGALPLEKINLKPGQQVLISVSTETKSDQYTHAAVDVLLGSGKQPAVFQWVIGSEQYQEFEIKQWGR